MKECANAAARVDVVRARNDRRRDGADPDARPARPPPLPSVRPPTRSARRPSAAARHRAAAERTAQFGPDAPAPPVDAAALLRQNGNSLLKASLAAGPRRRRQAQLKDVSYTAVPDARAQGHPQARPRDDHRPRGEPVQLRGQHRDRPARPASTRRSTEFVKLKLNNFEIEGGAIGPVPPSIAMNGNREFTGEGTVDRSRPLHRPHHRRGARRQAQRHARAPGPQAHQDRRGGAGLHAHRHLPRRGHHRRQHDPQHRSSTTRSWPRPTRAPSETPPARAGAGNYWTRSARSDR